MSSDKEVRAAIYARISLARPDTSGGDVSTAGVERQEADALRLARGLGWEVVETYRDNNLSAYSSSKVRPQFERLISAVETGEFDAVVVWHLDRLARRSQDLTRLIDAAPKGFTVQSVQGLSFTVGDPSGMMMAGMLTLVSTFESAHKGERVRAARLQRAQKGTPPPVPIFGYGHGWAIIEDDAAIVREAFNLFLDGGENVAQVTRFLTERTERTWSTFGTRKMLGDLRYAGVVTLAGEVLEEAVATWPPIVDPMVVKRVRAALDRPGRRTSNSQGARNSWGSGLFTCGICGGAINGCRIRTTRKIGHVDYRGYTCRRSPGDVSTDHLRKKGALVDGWVLGLVLARLDGASLLPATTVSHDDQTRIIDAIADLQKRSDQALQDHQDNLISRRQWVPLVEKINHQIASLEEQLLTANAEVPGAVLDGGIAFGAAPIGVQRQVIHQLTTVTLNRSLKRGSRTFRPEEVEVTWQTTSPDLLDPRWTGTGEIDSGDWEDIVQAMEQAQPLSREWLDENPPPPLDQAQSEAIRRQLAPYAGVLVTG